MHSVPIRIRILCSSYEIQFELFFFSTNNAWLKCKIFKYFTRKFNRQIASLEFEKGGNSFENFAIIRITRLLSRLQLL